MSTPDDKETAPKEDNPTKEEESVNAVDILEYPGVSSGKSHLSWQLLLF